MSSSSSKVVMILIDAPIPDYSTQSFRYVLEWDLETFPSPLEFVKSVAMEMRLDDVGSTSLSLKSLSLSSVKYLSFFSYMLTFL